MTDEELEQQLKDKTDFHKRLRLIALLREDESERSSTALVYLAQHDFVYAVRLAAWQVVNGRNIDCPMPQARPRYAIVLEKWLERLKRVHHFLADLYFKWGF